MFFVVNKFGGATITQAEYESDLSADEKVLMAVVRTAEAFKRSVSSTFRKYRLSFPQYNVLRVLDASKNGQSRLRGYKAFGFPVQGYCILTWDNGGFAILSRFLVRGKTGIQGRHHGAAV